MAIIRDSKGRICKGSVPWIKGKKIRNNPEGEFKKGQCGEKCVNWKGGRRYDGVGYIYVYSPNHPYKTKQGYVLEHRLMMEQNIGRYLTKEEAVHHINGIKDDNRIENLIVLTNSEHCKLHHKKRHNINLGYFKKLFLEDQSYKELSRIFNLSKNTLKEITKDLNLPHRKSGRKINSIPWNNEKKGINAFTNSVTK